MAFQIRSEMVKEFQGTLKTNTEEVEEKEPLLCHIPSKNSEGRGKDKIGS